MDSLKSVVCAGIIAVGAALPVRAADYPSLPPPPPIDGAPVPAELGTGWYLRGDVGYVNYRKADIEYLGGGLPFDRTKFDRETWSLGGGVGYQVNNWLRADMTADWRGSADFIGVNSGSGYVHGYSTDRGKLEAGTLLFNTYFELGNWRGVTPYVGAGVGLAYLDFHGYSSKVTCLTIVCSNSFSQAPVLHPDHAAYNLAWALMGGVAVDVGPGLKVDVGYRYVNLGPARTGLVAGYGIELKDLDAHEARIGVRYMID